MENLQKLLLEKLPQYSKNQKKLADYILENLQTALLLSVNDLAEKSGVSTATVVRFTQLLGFQGFLDFKNHFMAALREHLSPIEKFKETISKKAEYQDTPNKVANQVIANIQHTLQLNKLDDFKHIVTHMVDAENIFCIGLGISRYLAETLAYMLKLYLKKAYALSGDTLSFAEQVILLRPRDLVIAFSFPPYSRQTVDAAQLANELRIPVVSITDKKTAPIVQYSSHTLVAKTDNILFTNSLGGISVLMNALVTELALTEESRVMEGLQKVDKYVNDPNYFY